MSTAVALPEFPEPQAPFAATEAQHVNVNSQLAYEHACNLLKEIKGVRRQIEADRKQLKEGVLRAGRAIDEKAKAADAPWLQAEITLAPRITAYLVEQERIRKAEQLRLEEEARRAAEEEQLAAAIAAEQAGATAEEVDAIVSEAPIQAPMVIAPPRVERVAGVATTTQYSAELVSKRELIQAVARGAVSPDAIEPNMTYVNAIARAQKDSFQMPGFKLVKKSGVRVGGR